MLIAPLNSSILETYLDFPASPFAEGREKRNSESSRMIATTDQFLQAAEQAERLWKAIEDLREEVLPKNAQNFALMIEGPMEHIRRLNAEMAEYVRDSQDPDKQAA